MTEVRAVFIDGVQVAGYCQGFLTKLDDLHKSVNR